MTLRGDYTKTLSRPPCRVFAVDELSELKSVRKTPSIAE